MLLALLCGPALSLALEVRGANADLQLSWTPREAALGQSMLGARPDAQAFALDPSALASMTQSSLSLSHSSSFLQSSYHGLYGIYNAAPGSSLGFALQRFASNNIPLIDSAEQITGSNYRTFDVQDLLARLAYGARWGPLDLGAIAHLIYRDLDQKGLGFRADLSAKWVHRNFRVGLGLYGASSSLARWESEVLEYSPPEMKIGAGYSVEAPYFYGNFHASWQSAGIFQKEGKGLDASNSKKDGSGAVRGARAWENPLQWLGASAFGLEYQGSSGLGLSLGNRDLLSISSLAWGASFDFRAWQVSYGLEQHSDLGNTHRFALSYRWGRSAWEDLVPLNSVQKSSVQDELKQEGVPANNPAPSTQPSQENEVQLEQKTPQPPQQMSEEVIE